MECGNLWGIGRDFRSCLSFKKPEKYLITPSEESSEHLPLFSSASGKAAELF